MLLPTFQIQPSSEREPRGHDLQLNFIIILFIHYYIKNICTAADGVCASDACEISACKIPSPPLPSHYHPYTIICISVVQNFPLSARARVTGPVADNDDACRGRGSGRGGSWSRFRDSLRFKGYSYVAIYTGVRNKAPECGFYLTVLPFMDRGVRFGRGSMFHVTDPPINRSRSAYQYKELGGSQLAGQSIVVPTPTSVPANAPAKVGAYV